MKEVINLATPEVTTKIVDSPVPEPEAKQVLIKVIVSGSNPKDWKAPVYSIDYKDPNDGTMMARSSKGVNQGDDIAGIVEKVGADVIGFKVRRLNHKGGMVEY
jgi:NADPH2:quinone reductase